MDSMPQYSSQDNLAQRLENIREQGKRVIVIGLGISGIEALLFFQRMGIEAIGVEREPWQRFSSRSKHLPQIDKLKTAGVALEFGIDGEGLTPFLERVALAVASPGVSLESAMVGAVIRRDIPIVGEFELGVELSGRECIAVTGSNGKTTTVSLIHHLLQREGIHSTLCGNVGTPVVSSLEANQTEKLPNEYLVAEASSYQLESCTVFHPRVALLLNLSDNHLERHGSMERYLEAKTKIFAHQTPQDIAILNDDDVHARTIRSKMHAKVWSFGQAVKGEGATIQYHPAKGIDEIQVYLSGKHFVFPLKGAKLLGLHNRYNMAAAALAALSVGGSPDGIQTGLLDFAPLSHRLQLLGEYNSVLWINDSKSTTVAASLAAVRTVASHWPDRPIHLLLGGLSKAGSWEPLFSELKNIPSLAPIICFGKDANIIADHCDAWQISWRPSGKLREAVEQARRAAQPGDVVLFTPGCASFDEFLDFEHRGEVFRQYCEDL